MQPPGGIVLCGAGLGLPELSTTFDRSVTVMKDKADIGLVGLGVMGENLILNMEAKGFTVACLPHGGPG